MEKAAFFGWLKKPRRLKLLKETFPSNFLNEGLFTVPQNVQQVFWKRYRLIAHLCLLRERREVESGRDHEVTEDCPSFKQFYSAQGQHLQSQLPKTLQIINLPASNHEPKSQEVLPYWSYLRVSGMRLLECICQFLVAFVWIGSDFV